MGYSGSMNERVFRGYLAWAPVVLSVALLLSIFLIAESGQSRLRQGTVELAASERRSTEIEEFLRSVLDAETAQRGFLLTENSRYLKPYDPAVQRIYALLDNLANGYIEIRSTDGLTAVRNARTLAATKIGEIASTLRLYGENGRFAAMALINTDVGTRTMESLRATVDQLRDIERRRFEATSASWQRDLTTQRLLLGSATALNILLVLLAGTFLVRDVQRREQRNVALTQEKTELEQLVSERTRNLSELSSHLQQISETEKASLARELHDELGGLLVATKMDVAWLRRKVGAVPPELDERWERVLRSLEQGVELKRRVIESLRPTLLDNLGLTAALRWLADETVRSAGIKCEDDYPEDFPLLNDAANIALFRIAQESLTNVIKHSKATELQLELQNDDTTLRMQIRDNGIGIAPERISVAQSHGLASMQHRVTALDGRMRIARGDGGRGTIIEVMIPLKKALA